MEQDSPKTYCPVFEMGFVGNNPAVKVLTECELCPISLATLVTALFETVMKTVDESKQNSYETSFTKALRIVMKERHNYEITFKYIEQDEEL